MARSSEHATMVVKSAGEVPSTHVSGTRPNGQRKKPSSQARSALGTFYNQQQWCIYQPNSFISDTSLLRNKPKRVQQLQTMLLFLHQQQQQQQLQSPALMSRSLRSVPSATNRNGPGAIPQRQLPSGPATAAAAAATALNNQWVSAHFRSPQSVNKYYFGPLERMQLDEQHCMLATIQAQLLYNWYRVWEATDRYGDRWWKPRSDTRAPSHEHSLQDALLHAFYQLLHGAGTGGYFHLPPLIRTDPIAPRRNQHRTDKLPLATAVTQTRLPQPLPTDPPQGGRPSIGNNNPITPFLFVYVPLLTPLPPTQPPQPLVFAANRTKRLASPPGTLAAAIINDRVAHRVDMELIVLSPAIEASTTWRRPSRSERYYRQMANGNGGKRTVFRLLK
uniref:Uncharacterized protein n=1 Tax=Anopheles farauti TaxID=69004 RepID=A0A182QWL2_9DIPT